METIELNYTQEAEKLFVPTKDNKGDDFLQVKFYKMSDGEKDVDWCEVRIPGNEFTVTQEPVSEYHKARFAKKWQEYKMFKEATGTPIKDWTSISDSMRNEFLRKDFHFIEQVAAAPDSSFMQVMGGASWRAKAQQFLDKDKISNDQVIKDQAAQIAELQAQMAEILAMKKTGRPTLLDK
jgi:hypothetical protein